MDPNYTVEAKAFNIQPDGQAALAVVGANIPSGSVVLWNGQALRTSGGGSQGWVGAAVPTNLYSNSGVAKIEARGPDGAPVSNSLEFTIYAQTGPPPTITELYPGSAVANKGFNQQPGGESALGVTGTGFLPGVRVSFNAKEMRTGFGRSSYISAAVPHALAIRAGNPQVWVVNPDGKMSNKVVFKIAKE